MTDSQTLLADYARNGSEDAFRELVKRYVDFVYSTAIRLVDADTLLAQDVAQIVFIDLAREARKFSGATMLGGWLHRHTCFIAANAMRGERRRQTRERQAVEMNALHDSSENHLAPIKAILDDAINCLSTDDRTAILLRFFEQRDFRSVGEALGTTENTARMRVTRAVEKLEVLLKNRGVVYPAAAMATALATEAVSAAPATLALNISNVALTAAAAKSGVSAFTVLKIMTVTKIKVGIISAVVVAGVTTSVLMQNRAQGRLNEMNNLLAKQRAEIAGLKSDNERLSRQAAGPAFSQEQSDELAKLRGETVTLRGATNNLATLREENRRLNAPANKTPTEQQDKEANIARITYSKQWGLAFIMYAQDHQEQLPASFEDAAAFVSDEFKSRTDIRPDDFEIVYKGKLSDVKSPATTIVLREKNARQLSTGKWTRAYGFVDGHCETHQEPTQDFDAWEKERIVTPPTQ